MMELVKKEAFEISKKTEDERTKLAALKFAADAVTKLFKQVNRMEPSVS
jgi:hypothetical protein